MSLIFRHNYIANSNRLENPAVETANSVCNC